MNTRDRQRLLTPALITAFVLTVTGCNDTRVDGPADVHASLDDSDAGRDVRMMDAQGEADLIHQS